jgi:hypothetical protein
VFVSYKIHVYLADSFKKGHILNIFLSLPNILGVVHRGKTARRPWRCSEEDIGRILVDLFFQLQCLTYISADATFSQIQVIN